jgi:hypothetical protein
MSFYFHFFSVDNYWASSGPTFPDPTSIKTALANLCDAFLMEKMLPLNKVYFDFEED